MSAGFTPGPWRAATFNEANGVGWMVVDSRSRNLARVYYVANSSQKTEAVANLMAAAPALYEALEPFAALMIPMKPQGNAAAYSIRFKDIERAIAVLKQARGEA